MDAEAMEKVKFHQPDLTDASLQSALRLSTVAAERRAGEEQEASAGRCGGPLMLLLLLNWNHCVMSVAH